MFISITAFIKKHNLSISKTILENIASTDGIKTAPASLKHNEDQLLLLFNKYNFTCDLIIKDTIEPDTHIEEKKKQYVYLMKIYLENGEFSGRCKIGISIAPHERARKISKDVKFSCRVHVVSAEMDNAYELEQSIHKVLRLKGLKYEANNSFDGSTELFTYSEWMDFLVL